MKTVSKIVLLLCSLLQKKLMTTTAYDPLWPTTPISSPSYSRRPVPSQMYDSLTAADIDDNLNYETYQMYARQNWNESDQLPNPDEWLTHRISVQVTDENGNPFSGATVHVQGEEEDHTFTTGSDGKLAIFPQIDLDYYDDEQLYLIHASNGLVASDATGFLIDESSDDDIAVNLVIPTTSESPTEMDLALVLDTTGSMCDELDFLKQELEHVLMEFTESMTREEDVDVRIALVFYKDDEMDNDSYVVSHSDFDSNREMVMETLRQEICGGGGDYPEAVHAAWEQATELSWRRPEDDNTNGNVVRVALLIGDAPPRSEHMIDALESALQLREWGVRMYGLATSDATLILEYFLRMVAVLSHGRHLWLTNDSLFGLDRNDATSVACFQVTELKSLLIQILVGEMEGRRIEVEDEVEVVREVGSQDGGICLYDMNGNDPIVEDSTINFGSKVIVIEEGNRKGGWSDIFITIDDDGPPTDNAI